MIIEGSSNIMKELEGKEGYRKTELGCLPVEWRILKINDIGEVITGSTPDTKIKEYYSQGIKLWASPGDLGNGKFIKVTKTKLSEKGFSKTRKIPTNSILVTCIGSTIGKIGMSFKLMSTNQQINSIVCKENHEPNFYYYAINNISEQIKKLASTQAVPILNKTVFSNIKLPSPSLPEQQKIAQILSCWDKAIEKTEKLINARSRLKKGLMQKLLTGKKRFKEFIVSSDRYNTEIGKLPVDWNYIEIKNIAEEVKLRNVESKPLTVLSCTKYKGLVDSLEYFGKQIFSKDTSNYKLVKRNHFAYATNHIEEGSIGYQDLYDEALISPMYTVFETYKEKINDTFLYKLLKTDTYIHIFKSRMIGSIDRRGGLRWKEFSKIKLPVPSIPEQEKIASVLSVCDREIELLKNKLKSLKNQKKGLMQKLLTGQIRVSCCLNRDFQDLRINRIF